MVGRRARTIAEMAERRQRVLDEALLPEERVLAEGRANWLPPGAVPSGGSTHDYLWLTDRRLIRSTIWGIEGVWTLPLDAVTSFEELTFDGHRYLLTLRHHAVTRVEWAPRWRFLWWSWGNAHVPQPRVETRFAFSRRDAGVAGALRSELDRRGITGSQRPSPTRSPRESPALLRRSRSVRSFRQGDRRD